MYRQVVYCQVVGLTLGRFAILDARGRSPDVRSSRPPIVRPRGRGSLPRLPAVGDCVRRCAGLPASASRSGRGVAGPNPATPTMFPGLRKRSPADIATDRIGGRADLLSAVLLRQVIPPPRPSLLVWDLHLPSRLGARDYAPLLKNRAGVSCKG